MSEIFRAKCIHTQKWVFGLYSWTKDESGIVMHWILDSEFSEIDFSTIGQKSDLTDSARSDVYEGDLVVIIDNAENSIYEVKFQHETKSFVFLGHDTCQWEVMENPISPWFVIGNKHDYERQIGWDHTELSNSNRVFK